MATSRHRSPIRRTLLCIGSGLLTATALVAAPVTVHAQRRSDPPLLVSYPADAAMTCDQISVEIVRVAQIAGIAAENAQSAQGQGQMAEAAAGVAVNAALYSGVLGSVPGLGLFANAAGGLARRNAEARARAEAERVRIAEQRQHTLLTGIYQGRQCGAVAAPPPGALTESGVATPAREPAASAGEPVPVPEPVDTAPTDAPIAEPDSHSVI